MAGGEFNFSYSPGKIVFQNTQSTGNPTWTSTGVTVGITEFPHFNPEEAFGRVSIWLSADLHMFFYKCRHFCYKGRVIGACCHCAKDRLCEICYGRLPPV